VTAPFSARTRVLALLGDPVSHSLSPTFQNAGIRATELDAVYVALRCTPSELPGLLLGLARAGGGGNVTIPHKELAAATLERATEAVVATGACNTFWSESGQVFGDNTDVAGFDAAARTVLGRGPAGARVLLIGAGGAARAAVFSLTAAGADEVVVLNRSVQRAGDLSDRFSTSRTRIRVAPEAAAIHGESFDLAVNSTSLGLRPGDPLPLPIDGSVRFDAALDLVYAPGETEWVRRAREDGRRAADGLEMLLQQGVAAFRTWWPGVEPPIEAMRSALPAR
jgi:shikimate dehydrogenase